MAKPKVIFVNRVYWPSTAATAQLLTDLAEALAARGWSIEVVAAGHGATDQRGVRIHRTGGSEQHRGLLSRAANYRQFRRAAKQFLAGAVQPGDIVVVMTDPPLLNTAVTGVAQARGAAVIHWIQDIYPEIAAKHFGGLVGMLLAPWRTGRDTAWQTGQACVALGEEMARMVTSREVSPAKVSIIPNWAPRELESAPSAESVAARRAAWGVGDRFTVAYSGNLGRVHEFDAVLAAARRLRKRADICFRFIGTGARWREIREIADKELPNVQMLPPEPRAQLAAALAAADAQLVTCNPAFDGLVFPSKLAGVLAAGRPVLYVGSLHGEIAQWVQQHRCGAAFAPADGEGLAAEIARWCADRTVPAAMGAAARRAYEAQFTFQSALNHWETLLTRAGNNQVQFAMPNPPVVNRVE